ncbi:MAG: hypothetical protein Q4F75_04090 [Pseudomonadota bacterium]|nr:hypothetical protein [Pseudomonadota bacterium]
MRISRVILLSTLSLICLKGGFAYADIHPSIPVAGTHTHITHNTLTQNHPLLSHLRLAAESSPRLAPFIESAMLTSCLPQAQTSSSPEVGEARRGVTSEASIPFSSNIEKMSLTGLIPPRELLTRLKSGEFLLPLPQGEDNKLNVFKTASVCFITDTGECSGEKFGNSEDISGGNGGTPDYGSPQELCRDAGFVNTPCPEGATPDSYCPYDASFHSKCACSADYNKTCDTAAGQKGVGSSCGGKYKECCNICDGYTYTSVPAGYVSAGECSSCDGKKYKVKCDPNAYVNGSVCGAQGGSGGSCTDDSGTHYKKCNCPNNYEWNAGQKKCVCATSFKYACNGTGYAGGEGNSCDGKFGKCRCASGYTWDAASGACVCSGTDWCAINQNCGALGYAQQSCEGAAVKCPFDTSYVFCLD